MYITEPTNTAVYLKEAEVMTLFDKNVAIIQKKRILCEGHLDLVSVRC